MFVHPGCTNSGLNAPGDLPESIVCQRIPGPVPRSRLLGLCHDRSYSLFVRSMSSFFLSNRVGQQSPGPARISPLHGMLFMIASNSVGSLAARDGFRAPELTLVWRAQWAENTWLRTMRRQLTKI